MFRNIHNISGVSSLTISEGGPATIDIARTPFALVRSRLVDAVLEEIVGARPPKRIEATLAVQIDWSAPDLPGQLAEIDLLRLQSILGTGATPKVIRCKFIISSSMVREASCTQSKIRRVWRHSAALSSVTGQRRN